VNRKSFAVCVRLGVCRPRAPGVFLRAVNNGLPLVPAVLDLMLWPIAAILLWCVARGFRIAS
jgi:hypothetical protein